MIARTTLLGLDNAADGERVGTEIERRLAIDSAVVELQTDLERCGLCGAPAIVELFTGYWLCRPCCDRLGGEAMKLSGEWSNLHSAARLPTRSHARRPHAYRRLGRVPRQAEATSEASFWRVTASTVGAISG
jgi:ribosomal protein L37AE/L43A